jgi:hypothetical protein
MLVRGINSGIQVTLKAAQNWEPKEGRPSLFEGF